MSFVYELLMKNSSIIKRAFEYYSNILKTSRKNLIGSMPLFKEDTKESMLQAEIIQNELKSGAFEDFNLSEGKLGFITSILEFYIAELREDLDGISHNDVENIKLLKEEIKKSEDLFQKLKS